MPKISEELTGACNHCTHVCVNKHGYFYCAAHQNGYFPDASWKDDGDGILYSECPSYQPDPQTFSNN